MNGQPLLARVARAIEEHDLEAILIGNAAAALYGAPVTTVDFDFFVRGTASNKRKKALGATLSARITPPAGWSA